MFMNPPLTISSYNVWDERNGAVLSPLHELLPEGSLSSTNAQMRTGEWRVHCQMQQVEFLGAWERAPQFHPAIESVNTLMTGITSDPGSPMEITPWPKHLHMSPTNSTISTSSEMQVSKNVESRSTDIQFPCWQHDKEIVVRTEVRRDFWGTLVPVHKWTAQHRPYITSSQEQDTDEEWSDWH
ncbi:hypothetical protein NUU61_009516 [Penicillium alfredii]|uniref:Uncharacterized protein n=1 Tax=Penicillium alfredii TaxID=1506179 RepID=A0A9W9EN93_9EURO|nr:uncharacterized protein NUU61_009516 [Penicillium alfredii]KAJ5084937.1 hypothetical protein NUU61_009516 [Penicillium alfredii]